MGNGMHKGEDSSSSEDDENIVGYGNMHSNMMRMLKDDVFKKYKVVEVIGTGSMGLIGKAKIKRNKIGGSAVPKKKGLIGRPVRPESVLSSSRETPMFYAIKSIQMNRVSRTFLEELRNEIDILKRMDHPNIVRAFEVYETERQIYMVLELCSGGDLHTRAPYNEKQSASVSGKLLSAIKYMHDHGVVHRDLKFENIMWEDDGPDAEIKVIDFGLSKKFGYGERDIMHEGVGTLYTMAPQVLQGVYTSQADLWSVGVIIYMLLASARPFPQHKRSELIDHIMKADYKMNGGIWDRISDEAKDMVKNLLQVDPKKRLNATEALQHEWLSKEIPATEREPDDLVQEKVKKSLMTYQNWPALKKIALNVIAYRSSSKEIIELRKVFDQYDTSNDGLIELEEFKAALKRSSFTDEEVENMFAGIDVNKNGLIQYTEFLAATLEAQGLIEEERIAEAFDRLDSDASGYISKAELVRFLGSGVTAAEVSEMMDEWDVDKDGKISYNEFKEMFRNKRQSLRNSLLGETGETAEPILNAKIPGGKHDMKVKA